MSLDITLEQDGIEVFTANITHNCRAMAKKMGIYQALWNPSDKSIVSELENAWDLQYFLHKGLHFAKHNKEVVKELENPEWGTYENFISFVQEVCDACLMYPKAKVVICK